MKEHIAETLEFLARANRNLPFQVGIHATTLDCAKEIAREGLRIRPDFSTLDGVVYRWGRFDGKHPQSASDHIFNDASLDDVVSVRYMWGDHLVLIGIPNQIEYLRGGVADVDWNYESRTELDRLILRGKHFRVPEKFGTVTESKNCAVPYPRDFGYQYLLPAEFVIGYINQDEKTWNPNQRCILTQSKEVIEQRIKHYRALLDKNISNNLNIV